MTKANRIMHAIDILPPFLRRVEDEVVRVERLLDRHLVLRHLELLLVLHLLEPLELLRLRAGAPGALAALLPAPLSGLRTLLLLLDVVEVVAAAVLLEAGKEEKRECGERPADIFPFA